MRAEKERATRISACFAAALVAAGCSPGYDASSTLGKSALLESVQIMLTEGDCTGAVEQLKPVYESENTDNSVRMLMASAYGCKANINFFKVLGDTVTNAGSFTGSGFWQFLATEFPSEAGDERSEGAQLAQDALLSVLRPGAAILSANLYDTDTYNPGSMVVGDRTPDSNAYLFFTSMAAMGALQNRYGDPFPNGKKGQALPWGTAPTAVDSDGCAYASAVVNFIDSLGAVSESTSGALSETLETLQDTFETAIFNACATACTFHGVTACPTCPASLRNRESCTGLATDPSSVAAAGIVNFINTTPLVGWETGP